jgi:type II secretory pathway component GspD/PulD (secretin)
VVNQTPDIQEQIADLLQALRRLQDQEVAIEVRFIAISEDFYERIGVNFNMNIRTDTAGGTTRFEPDLINGGFRPAGFIQKFVPSRFLAGLTPAGTLTPDLNIPINQNSFFQTFPTFGGYTQGGGLSLGLAFLSDIQVFLFLEAVQGDTRANVMQAPKITLFNGQNSTINVNDQQPYVLGVTLNQLPTGGFVYLPQVQLINTGINLDIQAVISADRRFVRLSLSPSFTATLPGPIQLFPTTVPIFPAQQAGGGGFPTSGDPLVITQVIQQPRQSNVSVTTTVAVPDGGTVLLGGLKRLAEARTEVGPPILSKLPYINRLFKNVGYGRDGESLMIMVTPRIIIQEEEELRQTGFSIAPQSVPGAGP